MGSRSDAAGFVTSPLIEMDGAFRLHVRVGRKLKSKSSGLLAEILRPEDAGTRFTAAICRPSGGCDFGRMLRHRGLIDGGARSGSDAAVEPQRQAEGRAAALAGTSAAASPPRDSRALQACRAAGRCSLPSPACRRGRPRWRRASLASSMPISMRFAARHEFADDVAAGRRERLAARTSPRRAAAERAPCPCDRSAGRRVRAPSP